MQISGRSAYIEKEKKGKEKWKSEQKLIYGKMCTCNVLFSIVIYQQFEDEGRIWSEYSSNYCSYCMSPGWDLLTIIVYSSSTLEASVMAWPEVFACSIRISWGADFQCVHIKNIR